MTRSLMRRLLAALECGSLAIVTPHGARLQHQAAQPGPAAELILHRWRALRRLLFGGDVGFAEAYLDGDWSSPDLSALFELAARNGPALSSSTQGIWPAQLLNRLSHMLRANTRTGSRRNIEAHYDLGNEFYQLWLDSGMSYSSALYLHPKMTLEEAQAAKQDRVLELLGAEQGQQVLEIGLGWGGLAERLARAGCAVTGLTLSPAQLEYAAKRLADLPVQPVLRDYRDESGRYDRIVSIEMIEAVGEEYWPAYFAKLKQCLAPGGAAVLQAITIDHAQFPQYRRQPDFIQRYIFPGGMLPSPEIIQAQAARVGLAVAARQNFGLDYARTLEEWRARFERAWPSIAAQGFPPRFRRLWNYYLSYCEGGFRAGQIDVGLWRLEHA